MIISSDENTVIIPTSAIRFRIIANSNDFKDQEQKMLISNDIKPIFQDIMANSKTIDESRQNINKSLPTIEKTINRYTSNFSTNYGLNYFPEKTYRNVKYEAGNYESLVVTLGDGLGENWWCVLFPPLCLLEATDADIADAEYSFFIKDIIDEYS